MAADEPGIFEIINSTRAMKRLKSDPVPLELLRKVLDAGTKAPSGVNTQPWEFLVVRDPETKKWVQERYLRFTKERFGALVAVVESIDTPHVRMLRTVMHLAEHLHEAPVLLFVCGHRDWPATVPVEKRVGKAPPPYGSIYPCVQNILLACRAVGLGASLTTIHHMFEEELAEHLAVSDEISLVALLPIGFPQGRFGPVTRKPAQDLTHFDRWGRRYGERVLNREATSLASIPITRRSSSAVGLAADSPPDATASTARTRRWPTSTSRCSTLSVRRSSASPTAPARYVACWPDLVRRDPWRWEPRCATAL